MIIDHVGAVGREVRGVIVRILPYEREPLLWARFGLHGLLEHGERSNPHAVVSVECLIDDKLL